MLITWVYRQAQPSTSRHLHYCVQDIQTTGNVPHYYNFKICTLFLSLLLHKMLIHLDRGWWLFFFKPVGWRAIILGEVVNYFWNYFFLLETSWVNFLFYLAKRAPYLGLKASLIVADTRYLLPSKGSSYLWKQSTLVYLAQPWRGARSISRYGDLVCLQIIPFYYASHLFDIYGHKE